MRWGELIKDGKTTVSYQCIFTIVMRIISADDGAPYLLMPFVRCHSVDSHHNSDGCESNNFGRIDCISIFWMYNMTTVCVFYSIAFFDVAYSRVQYLNLKISFERGKFP